MNFDDYYKVGYIAKPHGLKGELTIFIDADVPNDITVLDSVFVNEGEALIPYFITHISVNGNKAFVKFEDVDTIDTAELLCKRSLYLPKTARPKSTKGGFYDDEVIDFQVTDETLGKLGTITDVMSDGPNPLLVMDYQEKEVLIPINSPFITFVDKRKKIITVNLPDGFLDI